MPPIATFVHISDLHLGDFSPPRSGVIPDAAVEAHPPLWWPTLRWFDGYLGHSAVALRHLDAFFVGSPSEPGLKTTENATLVITGDVTAVGTPSEFSFARAYLEGMPAGTGSALGLGEIGVLGSRTVPGNHDHWPGHRVTPTRPIVMWGLPTGGFPATFPGLPIPLWRCPLGGGQTLVMAGINTDADVRPNFPSPSRLLARGHFRSQLSQLETQLTPVDPDEIRILLMHHSPQHSGFTLRINGKSRNGLDDVVKRCEISVLLTGHVHAPAGTVSAVTNGVARWDSVEIRSGTTTQRDQMPPGWSSGSKGLDQNTLLVHRLYRLDNGHIEWRTNLYLRTARGFRDQGPLAVRGRLPGQGVVVWPRT
jgi:hypothetical protein